MLNLVSWAEAGRTSFIANQARRISRLSIKVENDISYNSLNADRGISCNKSGLLYHHQNVLHNKTPYKDPSSWIHLTEKYQRKVFGRYGSESGVSPRICFGIKSNKVSKTHYEKLVEPDTIQSMISKHKLIAKSKNDEVMKREEDISKRLEKLTQWKLELNCRNMKKEADAIAAKEKKERLIEEVRRHFGYKVDPRDERFKEVLEQKEKEDKKKQKEAKRKVNEQKLMSKLVNSKPSFSK